MPLDRRAAWVLTLLGLFPAVAQAQAQEAKWYERLRFEGDFRLRFESFRQTDVDDRGRLRVRGRLGFTFPLTSTLTTGFRLATAEPGSVTSHNVTLTGALAPKGVFIDRAYLTWTPNSRFSITGGKFANPLQRPAGLMRSELIFDDEVTGEGLHEQLTLVSSPDGAIRRLALMAEQWILAEGSSSVDGWMLGGQGVLDFAAGSRVTGTLTAGYYGFPHAEMLARVRNTNSAVLVTNSVVLSDGTIVPGGRPLTPGATAPFSDFVSEFQLINASAGISIDRVAGGMPLQLYLDFVHNAGADDEETGFWSGLNLGTLRQAGDWSVGVLWHRVEQEAVVSMFSYSDLGTGGTNMHGPTLTAQFRPIGPLTLSYRHHMMRPVIPVAGLPDERLHRIMLDASVSF